jgi:predicted phage terminase large subunit-like protein
VRPLTKDEYELWTLLERMDGAESLLGFVPTMTRIYEEPRHLAPLALSLYDAEQGRAVRECVSVPPRHGKTEKLLHFIAWYLQRHPDHLLAYISYQAEVAKSKSKKARLLAERAGVALSPDSQAAGEWRTTAGGGLLATGVGGPLTSHGVQVLIVDDPFKNREEAESPIVRQAVHDWFTSTAMTRIEPGGSAFVVHTRWHDDDLIGRLLQDSEVKWGNLNLKAISDAGSALWPTRWPLDALELRRREVGPYNWASLYQGEPRPKGGRVFNEPGRFVAADLNGARIVIACDPAASESTTADHSAIVVMGARGTGLEQIFYVLEVWRGQVTVPQLVAVLHAQQKRWGAPVIVESAGGFKAVAQSLRAIDPYLKVVEVTPLGDKFQRAQPCAAAWNDQRVRVPLDSAQKPWLKPYLDEMRKFTGVKDAQDDQVDATSHAFNAVNKAVSPIVRGPTLAPNMPFV